MFRGPVSLTRSLPCVTHIVVLKLCPDACPDRELEGNPIDAPDALEALDHGTPQPLPEAMPWRVPPAGQGPPAEGREAAPVVAGDPLSWQFDGPLLSTRRHRRWQAGRLRALGAPVSRVLLHDRRPTLDDRAPVAVVVGEAGHPR